jgi:hypothetical protein
MRNGLIVLLLFVTGPLVSQWAAAGEISGTIVAQGRPLSGAEVRLTCTNRPEPYPTRTDNFGRYRLVAPSATGRCAFTVAGAGPAEVYVFDAPARYDFELVGTSLRRR